MNNKSATLRTLLVAMLFATCATLQAQIGSHRNDLSVGVNGGYVMNSVGFDPKVPQKQAGGITGGLSVRYVCEKYFSTICSILAEVNYAQLGWKQKILTTENQPVVNPATGLAEEYQRTINYVQIPVFAHLAWGKEKKGVQFFFQAGPQLGIFLNESTKANYPLDAPATDLRSNTITAQETMPVEKKIDYGIAAGLGIELSLPKVGHFLLEGRYYYGLANIYGNSKRDYFGKSNNGTVNVKLSYLFDITKTKN